MALQVISAGTTSAAAEAAGKTIETLLDDSTVLFVSGGSSLSALDFIASIPKGLVVALVDERFSENTNDRNWTAFTKTKFFARAEKAGALFIPIPVDTASSVEESGKLYDEALDKLLRTNEYARVIGLFGVGVDGHIAGVFPYPETPATFEKLFSDDKNAVGYDASGKHDLPLRVTVTPHFIKDRMTHVVALVCGEEKQTALARIRAREGTLFETPARVLHESANSFLFTDTVL